MNSNQLYRNGLVDMRCARVMFLSRTVMGEEKPVTMATKYCTIVVMYIMYQFFSDEILTITGHFDLMRLGMEVIAECCPGRLSLVPRPLC